MLISKQWLSEFVDLPPGIADADLAKTITRSTVEVEKTTDQSSAMEGMVVGFVKTVASHPNADRLKVCQVDVGARSTQIVCGGTNVTEGMKVAVALPGSRVKWHGEGDLVELAKTKIRGEESEGMICAGVEIGIEKSGEGEHEIMDLSGLGADPGTPLAQALGRDDVVFEIEHKSLTNRPDLMGHYGMAREIAALYRAPLAKYDPPSIRESPRGGRRSPTLGDSELRVSVEDAALCPRYMAVAVDGVTVAPSPAWLRNRLLSCGVRSINNVVDITNYVMLELGQPMHAFDADVLGSDIAVRCAKKGETIECLDEEAYTLDEDMLLVTDGKRPLAIAGVMGGMGSGVSEATTRIVFESANFNPVSVRKTSTKLALRSESSARFEKSLDPENCDAALRRAVELLKEFCPEARVASPVVDAYPNPPKPVVISLAAEEVATRLGADIPSFDVADILSRLGFTLQPSGPSGSSAHLTVTVPTWRATKDVAIEEDLIEEVARIWGYDRIAAMLPAFTIAPPPQDPVRLFARRARHALAALGATEAYRYAFVGPEILETLGFRAADHLKLANPLAADRPYLAQSLVPNLFDTVAINHRSFPSVSVFEIGRVFFGATEGEDGSSFATASSSAKASSYAKASEDGSEDKHGNKLPAQPYHMGVAYSAQGDESPVVELRRQVESVLLDAGLDVSFRQMADPIGWMHPTRSADILVGGKKYGILAEATPEVAAQLGIDRRVAIAEMNLSAFASLPSRLHAFTPIPQFPDAKRDLAFVVDDTVAYGDIERALRSASALLVAMELFDVYRGKGVEEGKKSLAVHLTLRAADRTLASVEADTEMSKLVRVIETQFGGTMRA